MQHSTRTTTALLEGLSDPRQDGVWRDFERRYRSIIIGFARRLGLDDADAADVAQETLIRFLKAYGEGQYDRTRGRLRSWIIGIARYRVADAMQAKAARNGVRGDSVMAELPHEDDLDDIWAMERRHSILRLALDELRAGSRLDERTIRAFEAIALEGRSGQQVAERLGMSLDSVYQAKNRVASRRRAIVAQIESLYDEDG